MEGYIGKRDKIFFGGGSKKQEGKGGTYIFCGGEKNEHGKGEKYLEKENLSLADRQN